MNECRINHFLLGFDQRRDKNLYLEEQLKIILEVASVAFFQSHLHAHVIEEKLKLWRDVTNEETQEFFEKFVKRMKTSQVFSQNPRFLDGANSRGYYSFDEFTKTLNLAFVS